MTAPVIRLIVDGGGRCYFRRIIGVVRALHGRHGLSYGARLALQRSAVAYYSCHVALFYGPRLSVCHAGRRHTHATSILCLPAVLCFITPPPTGERGVL